MPIEVLGQALNTRFRTWRLRLPMSPIAGNSR